MGRTFDVVATISLLSTAASILTPQYSIGFLKTFLVIAVAVFGLATWSVVIYPKFFSPLRNVATPPGNHWLLGQTRTILREPSGIPQTEWIDTVPNDGIIRYSNLLSDRILVASPKALSEVLVTKSYDFIKPPPIRRTLGRILGVGILLAEGDEHRRQRKLLMPAFAFRHVKDLYPAFWAKSQKLMNKIAEEIQNPEPTTVQVGKETVSHAPGIIEVYEESSKATLDIIGASGMGYDFNAIDNPDNKLTRAYQSVFKFGDGGSILRLISLFIPPWILTKLPMKRNTIVASAMEDVKDVCRELIANKRQNVAEKKTLSSDIISTAIESGGFTDEELVNQMMTFLLAGHETTSTSLTWAMYLLCKHPEIQEKLRADIRANIPSDPSKLTAAHIDNCHYLQAVCSESLRLWSPVPMTLRVAGVDTSIGQQFIPKGTIVIIAPWAVNRSKKLWGEDAKEFRPERWLDKDGKANNKGSAASNYSFLTFLHGPRSCIGQRFAEAEFACLMAAWVGRFNTEFEEGSPLADKTKDPEIKGGVTSKPKAGVWVKLTEVPGW